VGDVAGLDGIAAQCPAAQGRSGLLHVVVKLGEAPCGGDSGSPFEFRIVAGIRPAVLQADFQGFQFPLGGSRESTWLAIDFPAFSGVSSVSQLNETEMALKASRISTA